MKHIASVSFGKDSLAMLLLILEKNMPLDEVVFYDTGMEFEAIYKIRDKILPLLSEKGIKYTELKPKEPFIFQMFEKPIKGRNGVHFGYSWCGGACRWGTGEKLEAMKQYCKNAKQYVGIAFDEPIRAIKAKEKGCLLPLVEYQMTEADCLKYCYSKGFYWNENGVSLYDILDRVSCWCCKNKNLKELQNYYQKLPEYWEKLKELQKRTNRPFRRNEAIFDLEKRFEREQSNDD